MRRFVKIFFVLLFLPAVIVSSGVAGEEKASEKKLLSEEIEAFTSLYSKGFGDRDLKLLIGPAPKDYVNAEGDSWEFKLVSEKDGVFTYAMDTGKKVKEDRELLKKHFQDYIAEFAEVHKGKVRMKDIKITKARAEARLKVYIIAVDHKGRRIEDHGEIDAVYEKRDGSWKLIKHKWAYMDRVIGTKYHFVEAEAMAKVDYKHNDSPNVNQSALSPGIHSGSGVAVGDFNKDGIDDIFMADGVSNLLLKGNSDGTFINVSKEAGIDTSRSGKGVTFADYDNDGNPDIFIVGFEVPNILYRNNGNGTFTDVTANSGVGHKGFGTSACWADIDKDGYLDLYIVNNGDIAKVFPTYPWKSKNAEANILFRNNGNGTFTDITKKSGVGDKGWGLACGFADYNNDGYPDLAVSNDFGEKVLYKNNGNSTFADVTKKSGVDDIGNGMGVGWGDYNNDGLPDLYFSNMYANARWLFDDPDYELPFIGKFFRKSIMARMKNITRGNSLFLNNGDGTFKNVASEAKAWDGEWSWGGIFVDYDADGHQDIFVANGFISGKRKDDL